jgi:hypothetical protein
MPTGNDALAFYSNSVVSFGATTTGFGANLHDFSMGVEGTAGSTVPEPATFTLASAGLGFLLWGRIRRLTASRSRCDFSG